MRLILVIILLSFFSETKGQAIKLFYPNQDYIYKSGGDVFGIRVDSTKEVGNRKINFFPPFFITKPNQWSYTDTAYSNGPGYFGNGFIEMPDSTYKFFSNYNDTFYFNPNLNSTDTGYFYSSGKFKIIYTALPDSQKLILDTLIVVKSYQFHYLDSSGNKINQYPNNELLEIGRGLGVINIFCLSKIGKTFNFEYFQDFFFNTQNTNKFQLIGIPKLGLGIEPLSPKTINEFDVNDILQTEYYRGQLYSGSSGYYYAKSLTHKFLSCRNKIFTDSSIIYENNVTYVNYYAENNSQYEITSKVSFIDTVEYFYNARYTLPGNFVISDYDIIFNEDLFIDEKYRTRLVHSNFGFNKITDMIWKSFPFTSYCYVPSEQIRGLGGGYFDCTFSGGVYYSAYRNLVYYKKGNIEFGTPLSSVDIQFENENFSVYPNPFIDEINLKGFDPNEIKTIEVFDVSGKLLLQVSPNLSGNSINLYSIPKGIYFLKVGLKNGNTFNKKIVK